jgi:phosphoglycolate phosphatase
VAMQLAIFDFDGTLCATHDAIVHCIGLSFEHHGRRAPSPLQINETISRGIGLADTFRAFDATVFDDNDALDSWVRIYREYYNSDQGRSRIRLFPCAHAALEAISAAGIGIVVVSNKGEKAIQIALEQFRISSFVSLLVCDRPGAKMKPDPACFTEIIQPALGLVAPAHTIVIGDTVADIQFARNIGARSCWASYGYGDPVQCRALAPDHIVSSLNELVPILGIPTPAPLPIRASQDALGG